MSAPSPLALVRYKDEEFVVLSLPDDLQVLLIAKDWPDEFNELDDFDRPAPFHAAAADVEVVETLSSRLEAFNEKLIAAGDAADSREAWDWSDVNSLLEEAVGILPCYYFEFGNADHAGSWNGASVLDNDLIELATPAAMFIATHAQGYGEADVSALSEALEKARSLQTTAPKP